MAKLGDTKYPIQPGNIIRLIKPVLKYNKIIKADVSHEVFIWIHNFVKEIGGPRNLQQSVRVAIYYLPQLQGFGDNYLLYKKIMKKKSIIKKLTIYGYELIGKSVFNDTPDCWIRTRELINLR